MIKPVTAAKTPSMQVYPETGTWTCFSSNCSAGSGDVIDFIIEVEKYTEEQMKLIVLQRLKYIGIDYDCEDVLSEIVKYGKYNLRGIISFLKICIAVKRADFGRKELRLEDVERVGRMV